MACFFVSGRGGAQPAPERRQRARFPVPRTDPEVNLFKRLPVFERAPDGLESALIR
jgi:hypothetical protein